MNQDDALLELLVQLQARNYCFRAVTPTTHERVLARPSPSLLTLRDIFGWNRSFKRSDIDPELIALLRHAGSLEPSGDEFRSRVRVASLGGGLFLHSSFPTTAVDSVFFGPDTYRFANFIREEMRVLQPPQWIVDMGAGTGAGGIVAARQASNARATLVDINPEAVRLARINARFAGVIAEVSVDDSIPNGPDMVVCNPPYLIDAVHRTYRDGGGLFGGAIALTWVQQALSKLTPGGSLLLYTGAVVIDGSAPLLDHISKLAAEAGAGLSHRELDPDIFGEELERCEYSKVDRIAALGITLRRGD